MTVPCETGPADGPALSERESDRLVAVLKALANPVRFRIVELVRRRGGETCVCEFERHFELTQPTISHHLKILRNAGVLDSRQRGTWVHHSIVPGAFNGLRAYLDSMYTADAVL